jgi:hypothetical protein
VLRSGDVPVPTLRSSTVSLSRRESSLALFLKGERDGDRSGFSFGRPPQNFTMVALVYIVLFSCYLVSITHSTKESFEVQTCSPDNLDLCVSAGEMPPSEDVEEVEISYDPLNEDERKLAYEARNYSWPPKIVPDTPGWNKLMMRRFRQLEFLEDPSDRWQGYLSHITCT